MRKKSETQAKPNTLSAKVPLRAPPRCRTGFAQRSLPHKLVLRYKAARNWRWSTTASALSAVATALEQLPLYTNEVEAIQLREGRFFLAANKRAQHLARVTLKTAHLSDPLSVEKFESLRSKIKSPSANVLQLAWALAARVGDLRQVLSDDLVVGGTAEKPKITVTFRRGKGAASWGSFSCAAIVSPSLAGQIVAMIRKAKKGESLFSPSNQATLSRAIRDPMKKIFPSVRYARQA